MAAGLAIRNALKFAGALLRPRHPSYLIYFITARCNARCRTCFYGERQDEVPAARELAIDEVEAVSRSLGSLVQLSLSGGEPFLREDLGEVVFAFYRHSRPAFVTIPTNASLPDRIASVFEWIVKSCPETRFVLAISIDGIGKDHDEMRGLPGSFDRLMETYRAVEGMRGRYSNFIISAALTLSGFNVSKAKEVIDYIVGEMTVDNVELIYARGKMREKPPRAVSIGEYLHLVNYAGEKFRPARRYGYSFIYRGLFQEMYRTMGRTARENTMVYPCLAGRKLIVLREEGTVDACEMFGPDRSLGNVRDYGYDIQKLLISPKAKKVKQFIRDSKCHCLFECGTFASISFSPLAFSKTLLKSFLSKQ